MASGSPLPMWLGAGLAQCDAPPQPWRDWGRKTVLIDDLQETLRRVPAVLSDLTLSWEQVAALPRPVKDIVVAPQEDNFECWDLQLEQHFKAQYNSQEQHAHIQFVQEDLAQLTLSNVLRFIVSIRLPLENKGLMLHASSGANDVGLLFAGLSTAGKSTLAFGFEKVEYFSDDISLLTFDDDKVWLTGSPFFGIAGHRGAQRRAPLAAFCLLEAKSYDGKTHVEKLAPAQALPIAMRHVVSFTEHPRLAEAVLEQLTLLAARVPFVRIHRSLETPSDAVFAQVLQVLT